MNYNIHTQHYFVNKFILDMQIAGGSNVTENYILIAAAVIWEDYTV